MRFLCDAAACKLRRCLCNQFTNKPQRQVKKFHDFIKSLKKYPPCWIFIGVLFLQNPSLLVRKDETCDIFVKFFDFLRKIRISVEPKRHTMHLIFLPTLKLQGTEGSQGLHRSFPRCLPHLRSAEVKNGCISNTYIENMCHELH